MKRTNTLHRWAARRVVAALLLSVASVSANAYDFTAENDNGVTIYYNILSSEDLTCEVTYLSLNSSSNREAYSGAVVIPETVTYDGTTYRVTTIGRYAFEYCSGLTSVTIPNSATPVGSSAFYNCTGLTSVTIPERVTSVSNNAFRGCSGLTSVTIPERVTSVSIWAFASCTGLTEVNFNATACTSAGSSIYPIFKSCDNLATLNFGDNVTIIPNCLCYGLTSLTSVTIPNSVTTIDSYAFSGCKGLKSIYSLNPEPPTCSGSLFFDNVDKSSCTLYVPIGSKEKYATADQWEDFLNIVEMDMTPVNSITADGNAKPTGYYTTDGKQVPAPQRGINIIRYSDGTAKKVMVK